MDAPDFPEIASGFMNSSLVTTGVTPFTVGSVERFQLAPTLNGLPWQLTSASLLLTDPDGNAYTYAATVVGYSNTYDWTVALPVGTWVRAWHAVGVDGVVQRTNPITFEVVTSPGTPF